MQLLDLNKIIEFNDQRFNPKVLVNEPGQRIVLLCLRAGQSVPEHSNQGVITVQGFAGHATFYDGEEPCEILTGTLLRLEAGRRHRVEAREDAVLLVAMNNFPPVAASEGQMQTAKNELDLRPLPRPERHPLVFAAFDRLRVGESFVLVNDHDPQPLRTQIERMREAEMDWEYLEHGPETFRIRVTRVASPVGAVGAVSVGTAEHPVTVG